MLHPLLPVAHAFPCRFEVAFRNRMALVADTVNGDDAPALCEKPKYPCKGARGHIATSNIMLHCAS